MRARRFGAVLAAVVLGVALLATAPAEAAIPPTPPGAEVLDVGVTHTCAVTEVGAVECWGLNQYGAIGDGTNDDAVVPTPVSGLTSGIESIASGWNTSCAVTDAGALTCWGRNLRGQLGDGTTVDRTLPVDVVGLDAGVASVSVGTFHTCAVTDAGAALCWGLNDQGQVGDGTTVFTRLTPTPVVGLDSGVVAISAGWRSTCALLDDGTVRCWGDNTHGELGDGTTTDRLTPTPVVGLPGPVAAVATDGSSPPGEDSDTSHTCAVLADDSAWCWGNNDWGQVGDGTTTDRATPVEVVGLGPGTTAEVTVDARDACARTRRTWSRATRAPSSRSR